MAWMVSFVLLIFYVLGRLAFHETKLIGVLPYVTVIVLIADYLLSRAFKTKRAPSENKSP